MLQEFIPKLQKDLELKEPLGREGETGFALLLDDTTITISEVESGFQLMATLGELPTELPELFYAKMLRGNLFGQATSGAILGLDEMGSKLMLRYYYPQKAAYRDFKEKLEDFINTIDFWKLEAKSHQANPNAQ